MTPETHPIGNGHDKERVMAYLDGELTPEQASRVAVHLEQCAECRELADDLRGASSQMLTWSVEPSSKRLADTVLTALNKADKPENSKATSWMQSNKTAWRNLLRRGWIWAPAGLAVAALCVIGISYLSSRRAETVSRYYNAQQRTAERMPAPAPPAQEARANDARLESSLENSSENAASAEQKEELPAPSGPMIARTASLKLTVKNFDAARAAMDRIVNSEHGYVSSLNISSEKGSPQSLDAKLAIPAAQCDAALGELRGLGHIEQEQQGGEEVTSQVVDLETRLKNARETEERLSDILRTRTGKIGDVLDVEKEMARVRGEIESMEADQKQLRNRVTFASIDVTLAEEYSAQLGDGSPSAMLQIRNALVEGYHGAANGILGVFLFLLSVGPSVLLWVLILFWPARWAWRRWRKTHNGLVLAGSISQRR